LLWRGGRRDGVPEGHTFLLRAVGPSVPPSYWRTWRGAGASAADSVRLRTECLGFCEVGTIPRAPYHPFPPSRVFFGPRHDRASQRSARHDWSPPGLFGATAVIALHLGASGSTARQPVVVAAAWNHPHWDSLLDCSGTLSRHFRPTASGPSQRGRHWSVCGCIRLDGRSAGAPTSSPPAPEAEDLSRPD